jgi:pimeloyl-ACP methyl ester carboxylesterase
VLAPDLRGFGWSDAPPGDYAKRTFVEDVVGLLDSEGIDRARVIGHDWGGYTALLLALEHPERLERLVALDIAPPWPGPFRLRHLAAPAFLSYQFLLATPGLGTGALTSGPGLVRTLIRRGSGPGAGWSDDELDVYANVLREPARAQASAACYRTFLTRELPGTVRGRNRAGDLSVPALLAMGGASPLLWAIDPQPSRNLRVETISGAGHFLPEEAPDEVLSLSLSFLA